MIDHLIVGVSDFTRSATFYDRALRALGLVRVFENDAGGIKAAAYGANSAEFWISDDNPTRGKLHIAFAAKDRAAVQAFHGEAIAAGGRDHGEPGFRAYHTGYYSAFVLDPDGHNIEAVFHDPRGSD